MKLSTANRITARDVVEALRVKHSEDVFVSECKDGPSMGEHFRLDAWVMNKSWANACATGYEVKVSRSDFMRDDKWRAYLPYCNQLYFVCPRDLIQPEELSLEVGLYYLSTTGNRLFIKKKAAHREVQIPETLFRYILMCRVQIGRYDSSEIQEKYWRQFIADRAEKRCLGIEVSKAIRETWQKTKQDNEILRHENDSLKTIKAFCEKVGIVPGEWHYQRKLEDLTKAVPPDFIEALNHLMKSAAEMQKALAAIEPSKQKAA